MPDTGTLDRTTTELLEVAVEPEPLTFTEARWAQVTFEVAQQAAMSHMPAEVTRPIPCYARLFAVEGTVDGEPHALASLMVGGRHRMMPRNVLVQAISTAPPVQRIISTSLHPGTIEFARDGGAVGVAVSGEEGLLANVNLPSVYAIEPTMLRWDPWLGMGLRSSQPVLTEVTVTPEIGAAYLSKGATIEMGAGLERSHTWRRLRNLLTISACYAEGTLTLGAPQVVQELT